MTAGFVMVPEWLFDRDDVSVEERYLCQYLLRHCDDAGECRPGRARLAAHLHCDERTVDRYMRGLREAGLVLVAGSSAPGKPTTYRLPWAPRVARRSIRAPTRDTGVARFNERATDFGQRATRFPGTGDRGVLGFPPTPPLPAEVEPEIEPEGTRAMQLPIRESAAVTVGVRACALPPVSVDASPEGRLLALVGALVARCGRPANDGEKSRYRRAAAQLEQAGADATEVARLAATYAARWPHLALTPMALANNVTTLRGPGPVAAVAGARRQSLRDKLALLDDGDER